MSEDSPKYATKICGCGKQARYVKIEDGREVHSCNKYGRCPTYKELSLELQAVKLLLRAYREKRSVDGLNGRDWDASRHFAAEAKIEELEETGDEDYEALKGEVVYRLDKISPEKCKHCGAGDDNHHSYSCPTGLHPDRR